MRILFIKQLFHPEPTARSIDFATQLRDAGHEVQVLTSFPSYPKGEVYPGYRQRLFHRETIEGIEVLRVPIFPDQSGRAVFRILNYLSYALSATLLGLPRVRKPDVVFAYHGALPVGIPAMVYKWLRGVPFVYDVNDIWPDTLTATGMIRNRSLISFVNAWCNFTYRQAARITVLSEGFRQKLISRGVPADKVVFINQWSRNRDVPLAEIEPAIRAHFPETEFNLIYAGNLGKAQSLRSVVEAVGQLQTAHPRLALTLLGDGVERQELIAYVAEKQYRNVRFIERVPASEVAKYLQSADVLVVHLKDDPLFRITIPSKIIGCHHAGKPILLGIKGDAEEVIARSQAGLVVEPDNVPALRAQIERLLHLSPQALREMGRRGRQYYDDNFTIERNTAHFVRVFEQTTRK